MITESYRNKMLEYPSKPVQVILDTDTKNEIDDQFAIVYALLSSKDINIKAITAAPFTNRFYPHPALGMEASYYEILEVLERMKLREKVPVLKGSESYLKCPDRPIKSSAVETIISVANKVRKEPLYLVAIGAVTNIVSAMLLEPKIKERIVVVWLGGHPVYWETANEHNLHNDPVSAMLLFDSGVPLVWVPCKNVAEHLRTVPVEIEKYVRPKGSIGVYLADLVKNYVSGENRSKVLWDVSTIAYLVCSNWIPTRLLPAPKLNLEHLIWEKTELGRHLCRIAIDVKRDSVFQDFFKKLGRYKLPRERY